jgi:hypothetical protein
MKETFAIMDGDETLYSNIPSGEVTFAWDKVCTERPTSSFVLVKEDTKEVIAKMVDGALVPIKKTKLPPYLDAIRFLRDYYLTGDAKAHAVANILLGAFGLHDRKGYPKLFKFGEEFSKELEKVEVDKEIVEHIDPNTDFNACFRWQDTYVFVRMVRFSTEELTPSGNKCTGMLYAFALEKTGNTWWCCSPLGGEFAGLGISGLHETMQKRSNEYTNEKRSQGSRLTLIRAVNGIAYIRSGNPDLREYKPPEKDWGTRKERDRVVQRDGNEECTLVSWGWKKPRAQHADEWESQGHMWWAPVGPGRAKRELRWRNGSTKQWRKEGER